MTVNFPIMIMLRYVKYNRNWFKILRMELFYFLFII